MVADEQRQAFQQHVDVAPRAGEFACQAVEANLEEVVDFLGSIEVVEFREITSDRSDEYDIAFIEGSVTRSDEIERLLKIRERAKVLVALGA
ncbi:MAG: hypothetical protein GY736_21035, partial [Sphingomonas sp.]|nr:hypothetical protein [Sphingomonas sp.]